MSTIHIDPDVLWRKFCTHNVHAGAVSDPFVMNYYNFLNMIHSCELPRKAKLKLSDGQLGVIFRSVAYASPLDSRKQKSMRTRIYEATSTRKNVRIFCTRRFYIVILLYRSILH